ncbi:hypothetical protein [Mammaliicoccus sciuri]|nr:hypothetical protein [Mammaliicoccus sciuri]
MVTSIPVHPAKPLNISSTGDGPLSSPPDSVGASEMMSWQIWIVL